MRAYRLQGIGFLLLASAGLLAFILAYWQLAGGAYTVYADGQTWEVTGQYQTVQEVLTAAGVTLKPQDLSQPPPSAPAAPGQTITIYRATQILVSTIKGNQSYWTHQTTLGEFLKEVNAWPGPADEIYADGVKVPLTQLSTAPLPEKVEVGQFTILTVYDGATQNIIRTNKRTVGEALLEAEIPLYTADKTQPSLESVIQPNLTVYITRSLPLVVLVDGQELRVRSFQTDPSLVVAELGIVLVGLDFTRPPAGSQLKANDVIQVVRVTESFEIEDQEIPFETVGQANDLLEIDQRKVIQTGTPGILRQRIRVRLENGVEVSRTADGEWVALEAQNEIVTYGTQIVVRDLVLPDGTVLKYWRMVRMRVTSYTAATSGKEKDDPAYGITASGLPAGYGVVAIDPRVVPFRSQVYVPGYGVATAGDTGGGVKGRWIDLGYPEDDFTPWSGYVDVYYLTPVPAPEKINYLLPSVLP